MITRRDLRKFYNYIRLSKKNLGRVFSVLFFGDWDWWMLHGNTSSIFFFKLVLPLIIGAIAIIMFTNSINPMNYDLVQVVIQALIIMLATYMVGQLLVDGVRILLFRFWEKIPEDKEEKEKKKKNEETPKNDLVWHEESLEIIEEDEDPQKGWFRKKK